MYANNNPFDKDGKKKNLREGLPAYAYSRYLLICFFLLCCVGLLTDIKNYIIFENY